MPKKILIALLLALFIFPITLQATRVSAVDAPITSPATPPITNPISFFNLTGKVTYKRLHHFFHSANRVIPAENVVIKIRGFFDKNKKYQTTTDENGNYMINLPPGLYKVEAKDSDHTFFVPPLRVIKIKEDTTKHADFKGFLFR